jgi:hypothetical protein
VAPNKSNIPWRDAEPALPAIAVLERIKTLHAKRFSNAHIEQQSLMR